MRSRKLMKMKLMKDFVHRLYRWLARKVAPADSRFMVMQVLLFFGLKRFNDSQDLYEILDVQRNASPNEIRQACSKMSKKHYPKI